MGNAIYEINSIASVVVDRQGEADRHVYGKISEGQVQLSLIEYAMRLDQVLAAGSNTCHEFERTLADEILEIRTVAVLLEAKAEYISGKHQGLSVEPMLIGMRAMIGHYQALLPEEIATDNEVWQARGAAV